QVEHRQGTLAAHAAACVRHAPAEPWCRPARGADAAGPQRPVDHADLHARGPRAHEGTAHAAPSARLRPTLAGDAGAPCPRGARLPAMKLRAASFPTLALVLASALAACARGAGSEVPAAPATSAASDPLPSLNEPVPPGDPRIALAAKMPGTRPEDLRPSPV